MRLAFAFFFVSRGAFLIKRLRAFFEPASNHHQRQEHEFIVKAQTDEGHTLHGRRDPHNRVLCQGTIHFVIALKNHLQFQIGNFQLHPTWLYFKGFEKETVPLEEGLLFHKVISNPFIIQ